MKTETTTKTCIKCNQSKPVTEFYGLKNTCKSCYLDHYKKTHANSLAYRIYQALKSQEFRANGLTADDNLTVGDVKTLIEAQSNRCVVCGLPFTGLKFNIGHIVTLKNGGHLTKTNIQLQHEECNHSRANECYLMVDMSIPSTKLTLVDKLINLITKTTTH
jgi:5-methylcytosine-specific restriction endonuclease McrA